MLTFKASVLKHEADAISAEEGIRVGSYDFTDKAKTFGPRQRRPNPCVLQRTS